MRTTEDLLSRLAELELSDAGPFPYEGTRRLRAVAAGEWNAGFVPDLTLYMSEMAGYRSWGRKILNWPDEKVMTVEHRLRPSFFESFPAYAGLQRLLQTTAASDVVRKLENIDETRAVLLELLSAVREARGGHPPLGTLDTR